MLAGFENAKDFEIEIFGGDFYQSYKIETNWKGWIECREAKEARQPDESDEEPYFHGFNPIDQPRPYPIIPKDKKERGEKRIRGEKQKLLDPNPHGFQVRYVGCLCLIKELKEAIRALRKESARVNEVINLLNSLSEQKPGRERDEKLKRYLGEEIEMALSYIEGKKEERKNLRSVFEKGITKNIENAQETLASLREKKEKETDVLKKNIIIKDIEELEEKIRVAQEEKERFNKEILPKEKKIIGEIERISGRLEYLLDLFVSLEQKDSQSLKPLSTEGGKKLDKEIEYFLCQEKPAAEKYVSNIEKSIKKMKQLLPDCIKSKVEMEKRLGTDFYRIKKGGGDIKKLEDIFQEFIEEVSKKTEKETIGKDLWKKIRDVWSEITEIKKENYPEFTDKLFPTPAPEEWMYDLKKLKNELNNLKRKAEEKRKIGLFEEGSHLEELIEKLEKCLEAKTRRRYQYPSADDRKPELSWLTRIKQIIARLLGRLKFWSTPKK